MKTLVKLFVYAIAALGLFVTLMVSPKTYYLIALVGVVYLVARILPGIYSSEQILVSWQQKVTNRCTALLQALIPHRQQVLE